MPHINTNKVGATVARHDQKSGFDVYQAGVNQWLLLSIFADQTHKHKTVSNMRSLQIGRHVSKKRTSNDKGGNNG